MTLYSWPPTARTYAGYTTQELRESAIQLKDDIGMYEERIRRNVDAFEAALERGCEADAALSNERIDRAQYHLDCSRTSLMILGRVINTRPSEN